MFNFYFLDVSDSSTLSGFLCFNVLTHCLEDVGPISITCNNLGQKVGGTVCSAIKHTAKKKNSYSFNFFSTKKHICDT